AVLVGVGAEGRWASRWWARARGVSWALGGADSAERGLPRGARRVAGRVAPDPPHLLLVTGADAASRLRVVTGGTLISPLPATPGEWAALVREATLAGLVVVLELDQPLPPAARERIAATRHLTWVLSADKE